MQNLDREKIENWESEVENRRRLTRERLAMRISVGLMVLGILMVCQPFFHALFRWGFVPGWVKDPQQWPLLINARSETMADKPAFRDALRNTRCIVPATGYFEWKVGPDGERRPYFITSADGETLAFAGLYATWSGPNGEEVDTVCIVTTEPNAEISGVYDRMPAILRGAAVDDWLNTRDVDVREALSLAQPAPDGTMTFHPVGRAIGNANSEGPELIVPFEGEWESVRPKKKKAAGGGAQLDLF